MADFHVTEKGQIIPIRASLNDGGFLDKVAHLPSELIYMVLGFAFPAVSHSSSEIYVKKFQNECISKDHTSPWAYRCTCRNCTLYAGDSFRNMAESIAAKQPIVRYHMYHLVTTRVMFYWKFNWPYEEHSNHTQALDNFLEVSTNIRAMHTVQPEGRTFRLHILFSLTGDLSQLWRHPSDTTREVQRRRGKVITENVKDNLTRLAAFFFCLKFHGFKGTLMIGDLTQHMVPTLKLIEKLCKDTPALTCNYPHWHKDCRWWLHPWKSCREVAFRVDESEETQQSFVEGYQAMQEYREQGLYDDYNQGKAQSGPIMAVDFSE